MPASASAESSKPETGRMPSRDGCSLYYRWHPVAAPRGTVVIVHGFGEHSGRYAGVIADLNARGYAVLAFDYRGHGLAAGPRAYVGRFSQYLDDLDAAIARARACLSGAERRPLFVLGHSLGGLITAAYALDRGEGLSGFVVTSPALGMALAVPAWKDALGRVMSRLIPRLSIPSGLDPALVSRDPEVVRAYAADPLVLTKATARWYTEFLDTQARVMASAPRITLPALVLAAGADRLADPEVSRRFEETLGSKDKRFVIYEGLYHEIMNEPEKAKVLDAIGAWLQARS